MMTIISQKDPFGRCGLEGMQRYTRVVRSRRIGGGCFYFRQSERQTFWIEERIPSTEGSQCDLPILPTEIFVHP